MGKLGLKIVKMVIEGVILVPPLNEPYKKEKLWIQSITHFYEDGGHDVYITNLFGNKVEEEFYEIVDNDCKVEVILKNQEWQDKYYRFNEFKNACFNRTLDNPYQFPYWQEIK